MPILTGGFGGAWLGLRGLLSLVANHFSGVDLGAGGYRRNLGSFLGRFQAMECFCGATGSLLGAILLVCSFPCIVLVYGSSILFRCMSHISLCLRICLCSSSIS